MATRQTPSGKKLDLNVLSSNYHLEMNPSDVGIHDRVVLPSVIKEVAQTQQLDSNALRPFKGAAACRRRGAGLRRVANSHAPQRAGRHGTRRAARSSRGHP